MEHAKDNEELAWNCAVWDKSYEEFRLIFSDALRLIPNVREMLVSDKVISREGLGCVERAGRELVSGQKEILRKIRKYALGAGVYANLSKDEEGRKKIREWLEEGGKRKATHMILVYDAALKEVFHPYVLSGETAVMKASGYEWESDLCVIAVISFARILEKQIAHDRPMNFD